MMTVHVLCPSCAKETAISDWPVLAGGTEGLLFTCSRRHGGCGEAAVVEIHHVNPHIEHYFVTGMPLSPTMANQLRTTTP
jgi:hypothetical protein